MIKKILKTDLFKGFSVYFSTSIINMALPFLLLPILTRYLTPAEYGLIALFEVMITFTTPFIGMNMQNNITRNFFNNDKKYITKIVDNLVILLVTTTLIGTLFLSVYTLLGGPTFGLPSQWIVVLPILSFMNSINLFNLTIFRNENKAFTYGFFQILRTILEISCTLLFIIVFLQGWQGRIESMLLTSAVFGMIGIFYLYKTGFFSISYDKKIFSEVLKISIPFIPHTIGSGLIVMAPRLFIENAAGLAAVGIFSIGFQFGGGVNLIANAFNLAWSPWMYKKLANPNEETKKEIVKATYAYCGIILVITLVITIISFFLIDIVTTPAYYDAKQYVFWIALGFAFFGMYTMVFPYLVHVGKTMFLGPMIFSAAILNIASSFVLIKFFGPIGAAEAFTISYAFIFICIWWYANKIYPMPWTSFYK